MVSLFGLSIFMGVVATGTVAAIYKPAPSPVYLVVLIIRVSGSSSYSRPQVRPVGRHPRPVIRGGETNADGGIRLAPASGRKAARTQARHA